MLNIKVAKTAGFCFGVQRAVDLVYNNIGSKEPIYTLGPITHNEQVVEDLAKKGVKVVENPEELKDLPKGTIIIRAHGIPKKLYDELSSYGHNIIDATCPFVKKIHKIVEKEKKRHIIIVGNPDHPEIKGIMGWCNDENYTVIQDIEEAKNLNLPTDLQLCIVAQTTYNYIRFQELVEIISKKGYDIFVFYTFCSSTHQMQ